METLKYNDYDVCIYSFQAPSIGHGLQNAYKFINPVSLFSFSPVSDMKSAGIIKFIPKYYN